jgi:dihydroxyacetone kinase-like protein
LFVLGDVKKLINDPEDVVEETLDGVVAAHGDTVRRLDGTKVLVREDAPVDGKVAVVSGGGSGHEPGGATGYVGPGMLDGASAGEVFTSPPADEIASMLRECDAGEGVLMIVTNYEGDIMNFETGAEMAEMDGVTVDQVVTNDDVAVEDSTYTSGRRGVCGTILAHKVAGAAAQRGDDLGEVKRLTQKAIDNMGTMGVALTSCVTPEKGEPTFDLGQDEIELGIGVHGEPGVERVEAMPADEVADHLTDAVLDDLDLEEGQEVVTIVNGMGGTPLSELFVVNRRVSERLEDVGIDTWDAWIGEYFTSLDMAGCSVTVMAVDGELKELVAADADTPALTRFDGV